MDRGDMAHARGEGIILSERVQRCTIVVGRSEEVECRHGWDVSGFKLDCANRACLQRDGHDEAPIVSFGHRHIPRAGPVSSLPVCYRQLPPRQTWSCSTGIDRNAALIIAPDA